MHKSKKIGMPLKVGLIGVGGIAQVIHIPLLKKHPDVQIQALCDVDMSKAAIVAEKFSIPSVYQDIEVMLNRESLDVLFLLTPNNLHLPMSVLALDYGLHVFLEKPAARNRLEVEKIKKHAQSSGKTVMVGMQNRFRTDVQALQKFIQGKELGRLFFIKGSWLHAQHQSVKPPWLFNKNVAGGGVVIDLGVQMTDLVWWLMGKPNPKAVKASAYNINSHLSVDDFCVTCVNFDNDVSFSLEVSWEFPILHDQFYLEIIGEKGVATLNPLKLQKMMHGQMMNITPEIKESKIANFKLGYQNEVNHFIDFLTGRVDQLESNIDDALMVFDVIDGIYESIKTGREILLT